MKSALILVATAAAASAQVTNNNGTFTCDKPNVNYCAGGSLGTDIIIRCNANGIGQPGRCTDNLAGQPPQGVQPALCYQSGATVGDAACEKNCVVYPENGSAPFTLPASQCTPYYTASSSTYPPTTYPTSYPPTSYPPTTTSTYKPTSYPPTTYPTSSCPPTLSTKTTPSTSSCPPTYTQSPPHSTGGSGNPPPVNNGTYSPTQTPPNPTKPGFAPTTVPTAGASANQVGGALAALGLIAAALL